VPQAVVAFLDGVSFEDCIRNAISLGGDSDTLACITGSIAEAYYGVPSDIREKAMKYLPDELKEIVTEFERKHSSRTSRK
jgi:ADP-ribosylglycohydrolase